MKYVPNYFYKVLIKYYGNLRTHIELDFNKIGFSHGQNIGAWGFGCTRGLRKKFSFIWFCEALSLLKNEGDRLRFEMPEVVDSLDLFNKLSGGVTFFLNRN